MKKHTTRDTYIVYAGFVVGAVVLGIYFFIPSFFSVEYSDAREEVVATSTIEEAPVWKATHIATPKPLRGIYMTSWVAGTPRIREKLVKLIDETEINAIVIDIKDDTGRISFDVWDPYLEEIGAEEIRIRDLREFIEELHSKGVYVIGRVAVFQDPYLVHVWSDEAVQNTDGTVWGDRKGLSWMDASSRKTWEYVVAIGKEAYEAGFDEINYDYVRFPTDGELDEIIFPLSETKLIADPEFGKAKVIESFFAYLENAFKDHGAVISADLFGMVTTQHHDLNIGQVLERALPYFDYIAPMTYPSHYGAGFIGYEKPAEHPYEVIEYSMRIAKERLEVFDQEMASTTPTYNSDRDRAQLRPWFQDFDLGATYTADMVRAQIQASYDQGFDSWMLWDAANTYTRGALRNTE